MLTSPPSRRSTTFNKFRVYDVITTLREVILVKPCVGIEWLPNVVVFTEFIRHTNYFYIRMQFVQRKPVSAVKPRNNLRYCLWCGRERCLTKWYFSMMALTRRHQVGFVWMFHGFGVVDAMLHAWIISDALPAKKIMQRKRYFVTKNSHFPFR